FRRDRDGGDRLAGRAGGRGARRRVPAPGAQGRPAGPDPHPRTGQLRGSGLPRRHGVRPEAMTATAVPPPRRSRRRLRLLANVLIVTGALLLADAGLTLLWEEPFSSLYTSIEQGRLSDRLAQLEQTPLAPVERRAIAR